MGGNLAVSIRDPKNNWHKMDRWTNPTPFTFNNAQFIQGNAAVVSEYLDPWYDMCKDYDEWVGSGNDPDAMPGMAPFYCNNEYSSRDLMVPSEYGLVLIDFVEKRFWNSQGYTSYGTHSIIKVKMDSRGTMDEEIKDWYTANTERVTGFAQPTKTPSGEWVMQTIPISFSTKEEWIAHATSLSSEEDFGEYQLDPMGWDFRDYKETTIGWTKFYADIVANYDLTVEEQLRWETYFVELRERDAEDEE